MKLATLPLLITRSEDSKLTTERLKLIAIGIGLLEVGLLAVVLRFTVSSSTVKVVPIEPALVLAPLTVAFIVELVLLYMPVTAPAGTLTGTSNVQLAPGCNSPPEKTNEVVPDIAEPSPQGVAG